MVSVGGSDPDDGGQRILSAIDLEIGGNGIPSETGLYFAKIGLGTPSKDYYVQVDSGSDILWVNCAECTRCPTKSDLNGSSTSKIVTCDHDFCTSTYDGKLPNCKPDLLCQYNVVYGDGSSTAGYFVEDLIQLDQVTGNLKTGSTDGRVIFGCGAKQSGELSSSSEALDGLIGFGQANSSMLSQLASAGKFKKIFSHCLDTHEGGGIFTIGEVESPKVKTTPLFCESNNLLLYDPRPHYNVIMKGVEVGGSLLDIPSDIFKVGDQKGTIIDSGTTLAYLPQVVYQSVMDKILSYQKDLKLHTVEEQFSCFTYSDDIDKGFPIVTFNFEDDLSLVVHPHDYLFAIKEDKWCFGWQNSALQSKDGKDTALLGGTSNIKLKDDKSGSVYTTAAHNLSSASSFTYEKLLTFMMILVAILFSFV
ncbi:hypothetical protein ACFE04_007034 [Oxalis oulophora]